MKYLYEKKNVIGLVDKATGMTMLYFKSEADNSKTLSFISLIIIVLSLL